MASSVSELLKNNSNGHDDKHVFRVYDIAMKQAKKGWKNWG